MAVSNIVAATINALSPASSVTSTAANTAYNSVVSLEAGIYTITCASSTLAEVSFYSGNTLLTTVRTASGTVNANLSSAVTSVSYWTNTGTSVIINMSKIGSLFTNTAPSGTLDTLTTSGTYTQTGKAFVVAVGGGGSGGAYVGGWNGSGGGSGGVASGVTTLTGSLSYTIGAGGTAGVNAIGGAGGTTTFGLVSATGGNPGGVSSYNSGGYGGTPGGGRGAGYNDGSYQGGASSAPDYTFVKAGTTGGGRGSGYGPYGSGIGTGGADSAVGSGYGAGAGGSTGSTTGFAGQPGVIYVLRY